MQPAPFTTFQFRLALLLSAWLLSHGTISQAQGNTVTPPSTAAPAASADLPAGPGRDLLNNRCVSCHALSILSSKPHTPDEWDESIEKMIQRGAKLSDAERDTLVDYLVKHYPNEH